METVPEVLNIQTLSCTRKGIFLYIFMTRTKTVRMRLKVIHYISIGPSNSHFVQLSWAGDCGICGELIAGLSIREL